METTTLPSESRPIRMDPELAEQLDKIMKPLGGKDLKKAQKAVMRVYTSSRTGSYDDILAAYKEAIEEAVG